MARSRFPGWLNHRAGGLAGCRDVPEAIELREAGLRLPILKLAPAFPEEMGTALEAGITLAILAREAEALAELVSRRAVRQRSI